MPRSQRVVLLALAAAVVVAAVLLLPSLTDSGNEGDDVVQTTPTQTVTTGTNTTSVAEPPRERPRPTTRTINVRGGKPRAGVQTLTYRQGQTVNLVITSDTADEVHVHVYDITKKVPAGGRARLRFEADAEGIFEIEMHNSGEQIASMRVNPD